jgi:hypothetical protein
MQSRVHLQVEPPRREAARAVDVQLEAVADDVTDGLERKLAKHASIWAAALLESSACTDSNGCGMPTRRSACKVRCAGCNTCTDRDNYP